MIYKFKYIENIFSCFGGRVSVDIKEVEGVF